MRPRLGVAGILATIMLFALLFTVGLSYFLFVSQGTLATNQANAARQNALLQSGQEALLPKLVLNGTTFVVSLNNTGGAPVTISSIYVDDNTGKLIGTFMGPAGTNASTWPISLAVGQSTKTLGGCAGVGCSRNIALSGYSYTAGTPVTVEIVTANGNTFSAPYPPPGATTTTSATIDSVTTSVTSSVIGNGANALVAKMVATPSQTLACSSCVTDTVTVYNYAASGVTGVTITMNTPAVTGTASVAVASPCSPSPQSIGAYSGSGNPPSVTFACTYSATTGAVGGFASFSGSATGTLTGVSISSAEALSNSIQIGGSSNVPTQGAFAANFFFLKYSSCQNPPTSTSDDFVFGATQTFANFASGWTAGTGFTAVANNNFFGSEYQIFSSAQTNLNVGWGSGVTPERESLADAILPSAGGQASLDLGSGTGFNGGQSSSTPTVTLTTTNSNDVVILIVETYGGSETTAAPTVASVAGGGLTWHFRAGISQAGGFAQDRLEEWYAVAASPLSSVTITATLSFSTNYANLNAFGVSGSNTASPFDPHSGLAATDNNAGDSGPTISTGLANPYTYASPCSTTPAPMPPASPDALADGNYVSGFSDYYASYYVQVTNEFNATLPILEYSYLFMDPGISQEAYNFLVRTGDEPAGALLPQLLRRWRVRKQRHPDLHPVHRDGRDLRGDRAELQSALPTVCIDVAPGQTVTLTFAACGFGASNWEWAGTSYAQQFDNSAGCTTNPLGYLHSIPEGQTLAIDSSYLYKNQVYSQVMPFEGQDITNLRTASTTISCSPSTDPVNAPSTCTVTVTDISPGTPSTPTGTVSVSQSPATGGTLSNGGTCTLVGSGATATCPITFTPSLGQEGTDTLTATYPGDANHSPSAGTTTVTATQRSTSTSVVCTPSSTTPNTSTHCVITVADTSAGTGVTPTGTITLTQSPSSSGTFTPAATCTLASGTCSVTYTPNNNLAGTVTITGSYGGDLDHAISSNSAAVFWGRSTSTAVVCAPSSLVVGAPSTCTATVTDTSPGSPTTPTGTVTFSASPSGGTFSSGGSCTLSSGSCSVTFTPGSGQEGPITITASYSGDSSHQVSSGNASITATKRATSTGISCPATPPSVATICTFTITDTSPGTTITPTGTVDTFSDGGAGGSFGAGSCTLTTGACTATYTPASGNGNTTVTITAKYEGDVDHLTSTGSTSLTVTGRFVQVNGHNVVACIPVTLTNNQASPTPANFPEMVTVNSNTYNSYLASNLWNVNWQDGHGHILNSWRESGTSSSDTGDVYWVNLASNTIAASGGTLVIYYCMYAPSVNALNTSTTGEFPTATGTYAQYDDGTSVFTYYDNFAGATIGAQYTKVTPSGATLSQSNGITVTTGGSGYYGGLILTTAYSTGTPLTWEGDVTAVSGVASGLMAQSGNLQTSNGYSLNYWSGSASYGSMQNGFSQSDNPNLQIATGIMGVSWTGSSSQYYYKNYVRTSGTANYQALPGSEYYSLGMYFQSGSSSLSLQWARLRITPPSGVMPSSSFGSLLSFAPVGGNNVVACVPVTLTNSQSSATPANFQEMVTVNSNTYNSYLASNLSNVNWQDGNGNILNSWLESGNSNGATSTVYWVNLASNTIAANGGTLVIYYCLYGTSVNALNTVNTGEAPQLTGTYGQYDDGANVFTQYGGRSWGTLTNVEGTWDTTNGYLEQTATTGSYNGGPAALIEGTSYPANGNYVIESAFSYTTQANPRVGLVAVQTLNSGDPEGYRFLCQQGNNGNGCISLLNDLIVWQVNGAYQGAVSTSYTMSVVDSAGTWSGTLYSGYGITGASLTNLPSTAYAAANENGATTGYVGVSAGYYSGSTVAANPAHFQWFRLRQLPPSNIMPSSSFGSLHVFAPVGANNVVACVPVTLTNSQSSATPANFQEMVTVNSNTYNSYLASNLSNVNWQDGNGHILNSWRENGICPRTPATSIGSTSALTSYRRTEGFFTVYDCMYGTSVNALNTSTTGEFPTATGTYGQYDDGANVFTNYWNFAGTSVPGGLTVASGTSGTDYSFNNGLTLLTNTARIQSTGTFNQNFVLEGYNDFISNAVNGWGFGLYSSSANAYGLHPDQSPWGTTWYYNNGYTEISGSGHAVPNYFIWQVVNNAGSITTNLDSPAYSAYFTATFSNGGTALPIMVGHRFDSFAQGQSMNDVFYWLRVRNLPPSNVMPSASFGSPGLSGQYMGPANLSGSKAAGQAFGAAFAPWSSLVARAAELVTNRSSPWPSLSSAIVMSAGALDSAWMALSASADQALAGTPNAESQSSSPSSWVGAALPATLTGALALTSSLGQEPGGIASASGTPSPALRRAVNLTATPPYRNLELMIAR